jgi:multiple sugar transport system ATP-binding protein
MSYLTATSITKQFDGPEGTITAVDNIDLAVEEGEFLVLVGPSGCGKTTTLRMIAGLEQPDEGEILIADRVVNDEEPHERNVAMVFQNYALYPHKTVRGNIGYGLQKSTALNDGEIATEVEQIAEMMGIGDLLDKKPGQLSGGQKQRVATGRALVRDPSVFLLDEPLSNLDAKLRLHMRTEIQRIQSQIDTTTVYVTHDQEEAMTMGDRIAVMRSGQIEQIGPPSEIYDSPTNQFVAEFVGNPSMNFIEVELSGTQVNGPGVEIRLEDTNLTNGQYDLGIRPEDVSLSVEEEGSGTVTVVEPTGSEAIVYVDIDGIELTAKVPRQEAPNQGSAVDVQFPREEVYLFDSETGDTVFNGAHLRNPTRI